MRDLKLLQSIRLAELQEAVQFFHLGARILELGAGAGWQARALMDQGFQVVALETDSNHYIDSTIFPLTEYDGYSIPAKDKSFDVVFSSNVLEHVADIRRLLDDTRRVLNDDGIAVHILPSPVWRLWSNVVHPIWFAKRAIQILLPLEAGGRRVSGTGATASVRRSWLMEFLKNALPLRHGERGNSWTEVYYFSVFFWKKTFQDRGFDVLDTRPAGFFYTDADIFGSHLPISARHVLASVLGSSCTIFVLKKSRQP